MEASFWSIRLSLCCIIAWVLRWNGGGRGGGAGTHLGLLVEFCFSSWRNLANGDTGLGAAWLTLSVTGHKRLSQSNGLIHGRILGIEIRCVVIPFEVLVVLLLEVFSEESLLTLDVTVTSSSSATKNGKSERQWVKRHRWNSNSLN